jgi:hypothetical protein
MPADHPLCIRPTWDLTTKIKLSDVARGSWVVARVASHVGLWRIRVSRDRRAATQAWRPSIEGAALDDAVVDRLSTTSERLVGVA